MCFVNMTKISVKLISILLTLNNEDNYKTNVQCDVKMIKSLKPLVKFF